MSLSQNSNSNSPAGAYRPEIDGLRAIAVIPVIIFHAFPWILPGGFLGVDIFFVISGFLITKIILHRSGQSLRFGFSDFYLRRAKRIFPALFLVLFVISVAAWFLFDPDQMFGFCKSLTYVPTFISNIYFYKTSGYFDSATELKPLVHTWSLAIEEQFYIVYPVLLFIVRKWTARNIIILFAAISLVSVACAQYFFYSYPAATYFLGPYRFWEILLGCILAFTPPVSLKKTYVEGFCFLALTMIAVAMVSFQKTIPHPGFFTLLPTVGAALIIYFGQQSHFVKNFLSTRMMVYVGLISYSLYLWHQPLLAMARMHFAEKYTVGHGLLAIVAAVALSVVSLKYVETPARKSKISGWYVFWMSLCVGLGFFAYGKLGVKTSGFLSRVPAEQQKIYEFRNYEALDSMGSPGRCFLDNKEDASHFGKECFFKSELQGPKVLLWGDSHADALSYGVRSAFQNVAKLTAAGCPPYFGYSSADHKDCASVNEFVLNKLPELKPNLIILHANWIKYSDQNTPQMLVQTLIEIRKSLPTTKIVVVGAEPQWHPGITHAILAAHGTLQESLRLENKSLAQYRAIDEKLKSAVKTVGGVEFLSSMDQFCDENSCKVVVKRGDVIEPIIWDYGHLTRNGSIWLVEKLFLGGE